MNIKYALLLSLSLLVMGCSKKSSSSVDVGTSAPVARDSSYISANYFGNYNMLTGSEVAGFRSVSGNRWSYLFRGTSSNGKRFNIDGSFSRTGTDYTGVYYEPIDPLRQPNPCNFYDNEITKGYSTNGDLNSLTVTRADDAYTEGTFSFYVIYGSMQTLVYGSFKIRK